MPVQLSAVTLRLPLIQGSRDKIVDKLSGQTPALPRGNGVVLQCAAFIRDPSAASLVNDLSNIAAVTMQVRKADEKGQALFDITVPIEEFDNLDMTWESWDTNAGQQFSIALTAEHTGQEMDGQSLLPIYIAFEAIPLVGDPIFLGSIKTSIFEDGIGSSGAPIVGDPTYLTAEQTAAIYLAGRAFTATVDEDAESVDIDISTLALGAPPARLSCSVVLPADDADGLPVKGIFAVSADLVRVHFAAAATASGYKVTLLVS